MTRKRNHIDLGILTAVLVLMVIGLGVVYSASSTWAWERYGESSKLLEVHAAKVLIGILAIFIFMHIDYKWYRRITKPALIAGVIALCVTLLFGGEMKGAVRALSIGGFSLQPSEFAKYALVFHLAALVVAKRETIRDFKKGFVPLMVWIGVVAGLVFLQPNFSNGAMIAMTGFILVFTGRVRWSHMGLVIACGAVVGFLVLAAAPYRLERIKSFLLTGELNYQLRQGIIAFGNGGILGLGPGQTRQSDFFLPESYGDFVYSVIGEEYGLIGSLIVMFLFLVIMLRGLKTAKYAPDEFGRLLAVGITSCITLYALVNAGVTLGLLPTTGLPMPFVSYGGSAMLVSSVAVGVLLNISSHTDLHPRVNGTPGVPPMEPKGTAVGAVYS
ncbi:MAG: putative lipid II flippase FtsW [Ignavibacteria bacterium]|nr:putative lipid II flippase FtsW [Ignavibacteria bacterium]